MKIIRYSVCISFACLFAAWVVWYVHMLSTGGNASVVKTAHAKTNVVQTIGVDYDEDEETDEVQKKSISLSDLDPDVKKYPSDDDWENMLLDSKNDRKIADKIEDILNDIEFDEKWSEMSRACEILNATPDWHTNVSEEVQTAFLSSLRGFMPISIPEVIPFLGSSHEDVAELAMTEIKDYIDDSEDENTIATLIVRLSSVVNDEDFAEDLVLKIDSLDTEIAAITMLGMMRNGTETIKKSLSENMEYITDQTEMTEEAVLNWAVSKKSDDESDSNQ